MKDIDFESIGKKLKEIRLSKGLPQDAVASAAEVNTSHISNIENNRVKVSLPTLIYICNALGVTVDYECERDKYMAVAEVAKKESFMAGFNYAVRLLEGTHNP